MSGRASALLAAAAAMLAVPAAAAERATPERLTQAVQPADAPPAMLASAAAVQLPAGFKDQAPATPAPKRRAARVTSCRCGDQAAPAAGAETPQR